ncbi:unnamed protein product [Macrosiphum euphorbiae]|uniref:C2H2-type domain-containing protein n=1 Tax=Macrosiphum euphorbiae TaxID=13131 RepID=A0AAV0XK22_9HEMI|nr:unnamed protein product [Macrosiphum euphorbiae]
MLNIFFFSEHIDPIECPNFCGRSYKGKFQKSSLRRHLIYECGVVPQFQCPECQKRFADKGSMKRHNIYYQILYSVRTIVVDIIQEKNICLLVKDLSAQKNVVNRTRTNTPLNDIYFLNVVVKKHSLVTCAVKNFHRTLI